MVGGTIFHRGVIQREISRVLVLNLSGKPGGAYAPPRTTSLLTGTSLLSRGTHSCGGVGQVKARATRAEQCRSRRSFAPAEERLRSG